MSLKQKYNKIVEHFRFQGTFQELKKIVTAGAGQGAWKVSEKTIKFVSTDRGLELKWSQSSGVGLLIYYDDRNWRGRDYSVQTEDPSEFVKREWATIGHGANAGKSLPQLLLNSPCECLELCGAEESQGEALDRDAIAIWDKIGRIRIPNRCEQRAACAHYFDSDDRYYGFEVVGVLDHFPQESGLVLVQGHIDLRQPWLSVSSDDDVDLVAGCLVRAVGKERLGRLDRESCEQFFNDSDNFVPNLSSEVKPIRSYRLGPDGIVARAMRV